MKGKNQFKYCSPFYLEVTWKRKIVGSPLINIFTIATSLNMFVVQTNSAVTPDCTTLINMIFLWFEAVVIEHKQAVQYQLVF